MRKEGKLLEVADRFELSKSPHAYIISVHIQNLMAKYGEVYVKEIIKDLFFTEVRKTNKTQRTKSSKVLKVSNE